MNADRDPQLQGAIEAIVVPGVLLDHRRIAAGDEHALLPAERQAFASSVTKVQRASGAARIVARTLLEKLGRMPDAIPRSASGPPTWPPGVVGSLAHDSEFAVAGIAWQRDYCSLGVDVEPAEPLDRDLVALVATPAERRRISDDPYRARLLFVVKEAVYKATYPLDGRFLDHHDVEVCLGSGTALVRAGIAVNFRVSAARHIVALAFVSAS